MGLRLAGFEALQAGGLLEFGAREGDRWQVRLVVPYEDVMTAPSENRRRGRRARRSCGC